MESTIRILSGLHKEQAREMNVALNSLYRSMSNVDNPDWYYIRKALWEEYKELRIIQDIEFKSIYYSLESMNSIIY